jgi:nucleotide-binding universal stress UspA family protein
MFKKILLAATPQVNTQTAPKAAFDLARKNGAELILFHSLPIGKDAWCTFDETVSEKTLIDATATKIADFYAEDLKDIPNHSIRVTTGATHEQLFKMIHSEGIDLIVMGHHTGVMDRPDRMWGSVDTTIRKVCSNVFCPVLVVTNDVPQRAQYKRIVMATDFSTPSESALCYSVDMARKYDAHIDIFHVLDIGQNVPNPQYYMQDMNIFIDQAKEKMMKRYTKALDGISHSFHCWEGIPYIEILKQARWSEADLVIMAQYSSSEVIAKPMVGSTSIQVALSPGSPALIVNYRARNCMK